MLRISLKLYSNPKAKIPEELRQPTHHEPSWSESPTYLALTLQNILARPKRNLGIKRVPMLVKMGFLREPKPPKKEQAS